MARVGIVVEAQEGLTWERWRRVVADCERLEFASLRVSDHLQSVIPSRSRSRPALPAWSALHLAAEWTEHIELATIVSPVTFYEPGVLLRQAEAVDQLSGGRVVLGLGAGRIAAEHERFEIPFGDWTYRFDRLKHTIQVMQRLWNEIPGARPLPLLLGGTGARRAVPLIARYAQEWNGFMLDEVAYRDAVAAIDTACAAIGRDSGSIRHSLSTLFLIGRSRRDLRERAMQLMNLLGGAPLLNRPGWEVAQRGPDEFIDFAKRHWPAVGTPEEAAERLRPLIDAGVELFLFEHFLHLDGEGLELLATEVMPKLL